MTESDRKKMEVLGISFVPKAVYSYKSYKYERLEDAVRYAEIDAERVKKIDAD